MLETSKDILNIALAVWTGILTFFLCWLLYYLIASIRNVKNITDGVKDKLKKVDEIIDKIHDKIEKTSSNIGLLTEVIKRGIGAFLDTQNEKRGKKKKRKK